MCRLRIFLAYFLSYKDAGINEFGNPEKLIEIEENFDLKISLLFISDVRKWLYLS